MAILPLWVGILILSILGLLFILCPFYLGLKRQYDGSKARNVFLTVFAICYITIVISLYSSWGGSQGVADKVAIDKINASIATLAKQKDLDPREVVNLFHDLKKEVAYSAPALTKLGTFYLELALFEPAIDCFEKALQVNAENTDAMEQWIYAYALRGSGKLPEKVREKAVHMVKAFPQSYQILNLLAIDDYFRENYDKAIETWQQLLMTDQSLSQEQIVRIQSAILTAQQKQGTEKSNANISFKVSVSLKEAKEMTLSEQDVVFLFVRLKNGSKMPLAVVKKSAKELPFTVCLDDKHMMVPGAQFVLGTQVEVVAKISRSGDPLDKRGEIVSKSESLTVAKGESVVEIML